MGFSAPGLLPLLGLAALPLLIHILSRLRLKRAPFPSLLLLRTVRRERFSWVRLKEVLLLVLRTIALLGLLLALARPFVNRSLPGLGQAADLVLVIDDSYSMAYADRWDSCLAAARRTAGSLSSDRPLVLLTASGQVHFSSVAGRPRLLALLDSLHPTKLAPALTPTMARARRIADSLNAVVFTVTDLQARSLASESQPAGPSTVFICDVGAPRFDNVGVSRLFLEDPLARGRSVRLKAELANHSQTEASRTAVLEYGDHREERVLSLPPRSRKTISFETALDQPGAHAVRLKLTPDSLPVDDLRCLAVRAADTTRLLLVETPAVSGQYVRDALSADTTTRFRVTTVTADQLSQQNLRDYETVLITDALSLRNADWDRLDFYLRSGGTALLMTGTANTGATRVGKYAEYLGPARPAGFTTVDLADTIHPILERTGIEPLSSVRIWRHARLVSTGARVLARLSDGDPFILEPGPGVILWSVAPTLEFSDLVHRAAFVPLLHRTLAYLEFGLTRQDYAAGDTVRMRLQEPRPVVVTGPQGRVHQEPELDRGQVWLVFTQTLEPGVYSVESEDRQQRIRWFAVNPLPGEGDLTRIPAARLSALGYHVVSGRIPESADLTALLLYLAAAAFAAEMLLLLL